MLSVILLLISSFLPEISDTVIQKHTVRTYSGLSLCPADLSTCLCLLL